MPLPATALHAVTALGAVGAVAQLGPAVTGIPPVVRWAVPRFAGGGRPGRLALTFDDGPHPEGTAAVLRILAERGCHATFFVVGEQVARFPDLVRRAHREGHEIGVHGWDHTPSPLMTPRRLRSGLRDTAELVADLTGRPPQWYRPPYGVASGTALLAARSLHLQPVWWTLWARDWDRNASVPGITRRATGKVGSTLREGGTLLLHDSDSYGTAGSWRRTSGALPGILDFYAHLAIEVGSLAEGGAAPIGASPRAEPAR